jgi:hypothetical protein
MEKYYTTGQATNGNMGHAHFMLDTLGYKLTLTICNAYCFLLRHWSHEYASMLDYAFISCLVKI